VNVMRRQSLVSYGHPLSETVGDCPEPQGTEVLVQIECCGVCHSDLHMQDGYFKLGPDKRLDVTGGRKLPFTLGHEIAGRILRAGPQADAALGEAVAVYPWIGCGNCAACRRGEENICASPRHLGTTIDGGYATHVLVPHLRYLLDYAPLSAALAGAYMCSGLTAYAALKRLSDRADRGPLLLIGLGGVGMMGLSLAHAMFAQQPLAADIDATKRDAAAKAGFTAIDPTEPGARKAVLAATGGGVLARLRDERARQGRQGGRHRIARRHVYNGDRDASDESHDDRRRHDRHTCGSTRSPRPRQDRQDPADPNTRTAAVRGPDRARRLARWKGGRSDRADRLGSFTSARRLRTAAKLLDQKNPGSRRHGVMPLSSAKSFVTNCSISGR
jgi:D-arabinose 1-dehydrogenase-like Zn-dependent alcohol dehydrogenase